MSVNDNKAKMVALLALLDVLKGNAEMTGIGADPVGKNDSHGRGGKIRLRFTVFGEPTRLMELAEALALTKVGGLEGLRGLLDKAAGREDKLKLAAKMIATWTEILQRLLELDAERAHALLDQADAIAPLDRSTIACASVVRRALTEGEP